MDAGKRCRGERKRAISTVMCVAGFVSPAGSRMWEEKWKRKMSEARMRRSSFSFEVGVGGGREREEEEAKRAEGRNIW